MAKNEQNLIWSLISSLFFFNSKKKKKEPTNTEPLSKKEIKQYSKIIHVQPDKKKESHWV